jgi:hypothetical protein
MEFLRNLKVHKGSQPTTIPILRQKNPVHTLIPYYFSIHFNITILISPSDIHTEVFLSGFPTKFSMNFSSSHACYMSHPPCFFIPSRNNIQRKPHVLFSAGCSLLILLVTVHVFSYGLLEEHVTK